MQAFRYLQEDYVDAFFERGEILLTTYERCKSHEDESRRDQNEGKLNFNFTYGDQSVGGIHGVGRSSYMLCTSMIWSEELKQRFGTKSGFSINDVQAFCHAVSAVIPGAKKHIQGLRKYVDQRSMCGPISNPFEPEATNMFEAMRTGTGDTEAPFRKTQEAMSIRLHGHLSDKAYFMKEKQFQIEQEFRFVWAVDQPVSEPIVMICRESVRHCTRLY